MLKLVLTAAVFTGIISCNNHTIKNPATDIEIATAFIRNLLDNKLKEAEEFLLKDDINKQYFDIIRQQYKKKSEKELKKYQSADIIINEVSNVTDTVTIINYSNSYNKQSKNKVKVICIDGNWYIDLKYTFSGNM